MRGWARRAHQQLPTTKKTKARGLSNWKLIGERHCQNRLSSSGSLLIPETRNGKVYIYIYMCIQGVALRVVRRNVWIYDGLVGVDGEGLWLQVEIRDWKRLLYC